MDSPWLIVGVTLAIFLFVSILGRIVLWVRDVDRWTEVCAWTADSSRLGIVRIRLPGREYRVFQQGSFFRAERLEASSGMTKRFQTHEHLADAVQECWLDRDRRSTSPVAQDATLATLSLGMEKLGSEPAFASDTLRTA